MQEMLLIFVHFSLEIYNNRKNGNIFKKYGATHRKQIENPAYIVCHRFDWMKEKLCPLLGMNSL